MSGRTQVTRTPSQLTPAPEEEKCYSVMKVDNKGWQVADKVDGEYKEVFSVTNTRLTISERFSLFLGSIPMADVVVGIIRDQLQGTWIKEIIKNLMISFLSKWIDFNEDGTITVKGATNMNGNLNVQGTTKFDKDVNFEDITTFNGKADFTNEISASGMVDFAGQVDFNNVVNFDEQVTLKEIEVTGKAVLKDSVNVKGDLFTKGSLRVAGGIIETDNVQDVDNEAPEQNPTPA